MNIKPTIWKECFIFYFIFHYNQEYSTSIKKLGNRKKNNWFIPDKDKVILIGNSVTMSSNL